ncbi:MAG: hypothetical protein JO333_14235 [Verrucomicrobia bacterium]|nr:hypothetical protein [Verrucomicrobiota bacterium]
MSALRFDHYQIVTREDGTPLELGRGAMGVTYKGFDIDLRLPVTLKVIIFWNALSERLGL